MGSIAARSEAGQPAILVWETFSELLFGSGFERGGFREQFFGLRFEKVRFGGLGDVEVDRAAIGKNWLVRASHRVVLSGEYIADMRQFLEEVVEPVHGEYDGWEAEVGPQEPAGESD